ncbi:septum formation initiator family protein [Nakamurella leprariae]|uniref:Septum formation initiator family protein n=1 Tax=Nakamurella leprariae TaxID=2803911 RepID=A0A939C300_9ACTN|nr:septum formation initiator family protein [Nakamurella leprariae]MBM9468612.1 septum formation initiator family protein [Nakamurella leprariae]
MVAAPRRDGRAGARPAAPTARSGSAGRSDRLGRSGSRPASGRPGTATASTRSGTPAAGRAGGARPRTSALARQLALLGLVLCAVALAVAFPLRSYLDQKAAQAESVQAQQHLEEQRDALDAQIAALQDPDYLRTEARRRLQLVTPGETVFTVYAPGLEAPAPTVAAPPEPSLPWYQELWDTVSQPGAGTDVTASGAITGASGAGSGGSSLAEQPGG